MYGSLRDRYLRMCCRKICRKKETNHLEINHDLAFSNSLRQTASLAAGVRVGNMCRNPAVSVRWRTCGSHVPEPSWGTWERVPETSHVCHLLWR